MRNLFCLIFIGVFLIGCNKKSEKPDSKNTDTKTVVKSESCIPYFDFDEVEYYSINIEEHKVYNLSDIENKTDNESKLLSMLEDDTFSSISDSTFISYLEEIGYLKNKISDADFISFNKIFCNRTHDKALYAACTPIYRDILIFKNQNKIIGMAKICFDCGQFNIVGTKENVSDFGQSGDFEKLNQLLSKYREK